MSQSAQPRRRQQKTWSALGHLGRMPSEYEVVTHGMNHTTTRPLPLEMGPEAFGNRYLQRHRDGMALRVKDWNGFRDPDEVTYRKYNRMQDDAETFVDRVLSEYAGPADGELDPAWLEALGLLLTPQRYPCHGMQMLAGYLAQLAPSSYLVNAASFQTADELRRVQRLAYRTRQLQIAHPSRRFGADDRARWEQDPAWQPTRKAIELAFGARDWDEAFVALNLVIKPAFERAFGRGLAGLARQRGDEADALLLENLGEDAARAARWSQALARYVVEDTGDNREVLARHLARWQPLGDAIVAAAERALAPLGGRVA